MNSQNHLIRNLFLFFLSLCLFTLFAVPASAYESTTLFNGSKGSEVRELQQALIDLGYLKGAADGIFGSKTEAAVRKFQKDYRLSVDGLAGRNTRSMILKQSQSRNGASSSATTSVQSEAAASVKSSSVSSGSAETSSLFGTYASICYGSKGDRVRSLQQALITLGYLTGNPDGIFGSKTKSAVKSFQRSRKLTADGVAGKKTLSAIQSALAVGTSSVIETSSQSSVAVSVSSSLSSASSGDDGELNPKISAPSNIQLLHWFNDVKPSISGGQHLLVYDPASGLSWTLRVMSRGRHCDAEPLTAQDTRTMVSAFGGINTWNQKAVYVKLPDGRWSLASTHDMPHDSSSIKNNNFNGHLCVHFLRDMDEAKQNDPKYGVANQETIRAKWKQLTGEDVP
ncbi:MAG: peptidoglycan-binding protein [Clostridia bacterium]|nr:peptidoglycan-binding protein [Clostridia bacterium]